MTMSKPEDLLSQGSEAASRLRDFVNDPDNRAQVKDWADQATRFVQKNPWAAVAGAALIGYWLGSRSGRRREDSSR